MEEKITLCGDNCVECPRYKAHTDEELRVVAELWYKVGWRTRIVSNEEIACSGCSSHKQCTYQLVECTKEHRVDKCNQCNESSTMGKFGNSEFSTKPTNYYNLDMIISVGYRVRSQRGVQFRICASGILKEYMRKGFAMDDQRLKELGGGGYFKELLERIRDIRASEKEFMRLMCFSREQPTLREAKIAKDYQFC